MSAGHVESMLELEIPENPFPGLRPFEFNESLLYFGRDGQSEQLLRKLSATRFLAVVGTSGSGKSSLVRAGLLPALLGGFMTSASSNWKIAVMRPGFDPIGNLARALAAPEVLGSNGDQEVLSAMAESTLRRGNFGLMDLAQQARIRSGQNLLIVVDQFEELFRVAEFAESEAYLNHAAAFVKLLLEASRQKELSIYVVLTMRSDFLGDCSSFWGLPEAINEGQYLIPRLTREQRREAITGPIAVCGGAITDRLVTRLLNDMGDDQDQLPLLQHALMRTWGKWKEEGAGRPAIDLEHYESIGGMFDALSLHADEAFNSLPDERSHEVAEKAFKGLTEKGSDNREIRRPVTLGGLSVVTGAEESELARVIDTFRQHERSFLMPPAEVPLTSAAMIDISHESLIRNWRRLKGWVDDEARSARIYRRLAETAALYKEGKAGLWRDPDLQVALTWREQTRPNKEWAERYHHEFEGAIAFLDESLAERGAEQRAREAEAQDKEIRRCRQVRNARVTTIAVALALMVSLGALVYANRQRQEAISQKQEAIIQREQASTNLEIARSNEALALTERSNFEKEKEKAETNEKVAKENGRRALIQKDRADKQTEIAQQGAEKARLAEENTRHLLYAANFKLAQRAYRTKDFARGDELLAGSEKSSRGFEWWHLWNRYHSAEHTINGYARSLTSVAFNPVNKSLLATGSADGTLALVNSTTGESEALKTDVSSVWGSIFSPDGNKLAVLGDVLGESNKVELWDIATKQSLGPLPRVPGGFQIECIAFLQAGKIAAGHEQGSITVWDLEAPNQIHTLEYPDHEEAMPDVVALASPPGGNVLVSGYENGVLRIWDPASGHHSEPQFPLGTSSKRNHGHITALAVSSDGKLLAMATKEGWLAIWVTADIFRREDFDQGKTQGEPLFEKKVLSKGFNGLAFSVDGKELATAGADGTVVFWPMKRLIDTRVELDRLQQAMQSTTNADCELKTLAAKIQTLKAKARGSIEPDSDKPPIEHGGPITCIAFSSDGHTLASGSSDRTVKVWRLGYNRNQERGVISPDGHSIAIVEPDAIKVLEDGRVQRTFPIEHTSAIRTMIFSADNKAIVARFKNGAVTLFHPKAGKKIELSERVQRISRDGMFVAERDRDVVRVWNTSSGEVSHQFLPRAGAKVQALGFSPDSKTIAVNYTDGTARVYYVETAEAFEIANMGPGDQIVRFSPDSRFLDLSSGDDPPDLVTHKIWNLKERRLQGIDEVQSAARFQEPESALTVQSRDGDKIASAQDENITLTDVATKQTITKTKAHLGQVTSLAFSSNGKILASGGLDGAVTLWDANSLEHLSDIPALKRTSGVLNRIVSLAFSNDGKRLAMGTDSRIPPTAMGGSTDRTGKGNGTLILWDLISRQELLKLTETVPQPLVFSADDRALGSHSLQGIWLGAFAADRTTSLNRERVVKSAHLSWTSSRDEVAIPGDALIAGYSSDPAVFLHVCRLRYQNNAYVGFTSGGDCQIGNVGPEHKTLNFGSYEILVNAGSGSWLINTEENSKHRSPTPPRIIAGKRADGKEVAICRATVASGTYIGWTVDNQCHTSEVSEPLRVEILHERGIEGTMTASSKRRSQ